MSREAMHDQSSSSCLAPRHLQRLRVIHQQLANELAGALSSLVRSSVNVQLAEVTPLLYGEFLQSLAIPSCFHLLKSQGLEDCLMLDIEPRLLFPMLDRMLGGGQTDEPPPRRPLSDVELLLAGRVARVVLDQLAEAWRDTCDLQLEIVQADTNPRLMRALPTDEMVVSIACNVALDGGQGVLRLCIPCRAIERMDAKLADRSGSRPAARLDAEDAARLSALGTQESLADIEVTLASTSITVGDLQSLHVGDIIATETDADAAAIVSINGLPRFHGKPGTCHGQKAVCLTDTPKSETPNPEA